MLTGLFWEIGFKGIRCGLARDKFGCYKHKRKFDGSPPVENCQITLWKKATCVSKLAMVAAAPLKTVSSLRTAAQAVVASIRDRTRLLGWSSVAVCTSFLQKLKFE